MAGWRTKASWTASQVSRSKAKGLLEQVLTDVDLPGAGWHVVDERAWRTGRAGPDSEWARRAREAGLLTAWRSFEQVDASRWLWMQLTPLVSEPDAVSALASTPDRFLSNARSEVTVSTEQEVAALAVIGQSAGWAYEQQTKSERGTGIARYSAFVVHSTLVALAASGPTELWPWQDVLGIAQAQADRLGAGS